MLFLIMLVIVIVLGFFIVQQIDQRRWQRYQFERDMFFRDHPLLLQDLDEFFYLLHLSHTVQRKIIIDLMLKPSTQAIYKKVRLQRVAGSCYEKKIQVILNDINIAELEPRYAQLVSESLVKSDFEIGRPIEVLSEILVLQKNNELICQIRLNLPKDASMIADLLMPEQYSQPTNFKN